MIIVSAHELCSKKCQDKNIEKGNITHDIAFSENTDQKLVRVVMVFELVSTKKKLRANY